MLWCLLAMLSYGAHEGGYGPGPRGSNAAVWEAGMCHRWGTCDGLSDSARSTEKPQTGTG